MAREWIDGKFGIGHEHTAVFKMDNTQESSTHKGLYSILCVIT